jgi:hypothetical protein
MEALLTEPSLLDTVFERKLRPCALSQVEFRNVYLIVLDVLVAVKASQVSMTMYLLYIEKTCNIPYETIIMRDTILAAANHNHVDAHRELVSVMPQCVNLALEYCRRPLSRVIGRSYKEDATISEETEIEYIKLFLENSANPNVRTGRRRCGGAHLTATVANAPLEVVRLLTRHGAVVLQCGALQSAVSANRIEVLGQGKGSRGL